MTGITIYTDNVQRSLVSTNNKSVSFCVPIRLQLDSSMSPCSCDDNMKDAFLWRFKKKKVSIVMY